MAANWHRPASIGAAMAGGAVTFIAVIPARAKREPQMCDCTSGNLEIPGSALRAAPE